MEHANDLRVQRTYKLLTDALMNMLCEQSFDTITVRTLCERAMVRPATFYKHFDNKEELFLSIVQHKQQQFRTGNPYRDVPGSSRNYYVSLVDQTLHFLEQNKTMVDSVIRSSAASLLLEPLSEQIATQVCQEFQEDEKRGVSLPGKPEVMAQLFTGALVQLAKWWALNNWETPREELVAECLHTLNISAETDN